jgi:hypothetical protein
VTFSDGKNGFFFLILVSALSGSELAQECRKSGSGKVGLFAPPDGNQSQFVQYVSTLVTFF